LLNLFRSLTARLTALFITHVALDFEQQLLVHQSDRKAALLNKARELEQQGLDDLAAELREQCDSLSLQRPLASVLPATAELRGLSQASEEPEPRQPRSAKRPVPPPKRRIRSAK